MSGPAAVRSVRLLISGRVQGVGFRYFTRGAASRLGVVGWVKNLPGGEVEVRAAGPPAALAELRDQLRQGPTGARVDALSESELAAAGEWREFSIVH